MSPTYIIHQLETNAESVAALLNEPSREIYLWKQAPEKWCQLEILCHLYDEEREDFKARLKQVLENPELPFAPINPVGWVTEPHYIGQNYSEKLNAFLNERKESVKWLRSLTNPNWNNAYHHPKFGAMSAEMFLANWLAHDYLHFRQITRLKYDYLKQQTSEDIGYAGPW